MTFALFFLAEYAHIIIMSLITALLFLGGWLPILGMDTFCLVNSFSFAFKISFILFFYVWVRASFPRYRIDQLMRLCWKIFLPLALAFVLLLLSVLFATNGIY
jgi:NADH:ubiquinone oxidoreductase subunit H